MSYISIVGLIEFLTLDAIAKLDSSPDCLIDEKITGYQDRDHQLRAHLFGCLLRLGQDRIANQSGLEGRRGKEQVIVNFEVLPDMIEQVPDRNFVFKKENQAFLRSSRDPKLAVCDLTVALGNLHQRSYHRQSHYNYDGLYVKCSFIIIMEEQRTSEEEVDTRKLFSTGISEQTEAFIHSKMVAFPETSQELQKLDLREMCEHVQKELETVQGRAAEDYVAVSGELKTLGGQLSVADGIMEQLEHLLSGFKGNLEAIQIDMALLQEKSSQMTTSLTNKKKVQEFLLSFIESAVLDNELKEAISNANIDENYAKYIRQLLKKFNYLNSNLITPDTKAIKELQPELEKLKAKASIRLRQFLLEQIHLLKKSKANIQILQKNMLAKYNVFALFFKEQNTQIYTELCNSYRETMAKVYVNNYKIYLGEVEKLQVELYHRTDQLLPLESQHLRSVISQIKHVTSLNQDGKSIFTLMNRDRIVQNEAEDIIKYNAGSQGSEKCTIERMFKSVNKCLIKDVIYEIIFTAEFFHLHSEGAIDIFGPLFRPTIQIFLDFLKKSVAHTHDIYAVLLMLAINEKNKQSLAQLGCSALENYFSQVSIMLWPKFEELFDLHLRSIENCSVSHFKKLQKLAGKALVDRFVDLLVGLFRLYIYFQSSTIMFEKRLEALRRSFFELISKIQKQQDKQSQKLTYYVRFLQKVHSACTNDPTVANFKEFHVCQQSLQKEIENYSEKVITIYIRDFFPSLYLFITKYSNSSLISEEGALSIEGNVDSNILQQTLNEVSPQSIGNRLSKAFDFCQKNHSGYCMRVITRKMTNTFTRFYSDIYKYCKANHPQRSISMLQTHSVIKQLKTSFSKYST